MTLRDRFLTRPVARAITAPSSILLAGAATAGALLAPISIPVAAAIGIAVYGARVALAIPREEKTDIDVSQLREPWRSFVVEAMVARKRYQKAVADARPGPLRNRLGEIGARLDDGVEQTWKIARRGMALESALGQLEDPQVVHRRLEEARRGGRDERIVQSLQAQLDSTERIRAVATQARDRLQLLDARLDEAVARAVELSLNADDASALGGLGSDVEAVVGDMEALRQALEETSRSSPAVGT